MRKTMKMLFAIALCCIAATCFCMTQQVFATPDLTQPLEWENTSSGYSYYINDEAGFISGSSASDIDALISEMEDITNYANVALVTTTDHDYSSTRDFAEASLEAEFGYSNGIIFVIDRDLNQIYLLSEGNAQKKISSNRCDNICDKTYIYATSSYGYDYITCCYQTFSQVDILLKGGTISQPMKYVCNAFLAIAIALLVSYFIARATSRMKKPAANKILFGIFSNLSTANPQSNYINTTRTYSPPSSSDGGGGSSGGGGGGGGSSGGGHGI